MDDYLDFIKRHKVRPAAFYVDPSAASFCAELRSRGITPTPANNDVVDGIRFVASKLENGELLIDKSCKETIKEISGYVWDAKAQARGEDKPLKEHDHCNDKTRYGIFTHFYRPHTQRLVGLNRR